MATLTLQVESPSILEHLKGLLSIMKGVKVLRIDNSVVNQVKHEDIPNATTMMAIKQIENGEDAGIVNMSSLDDFVASMD